jgi:hypothetical protein
MERMYETWDGQRGMGMVMEPPKKKGSYDKWYQRNARKAKGEGGELGSPGDY